MKKERICLGFEWNLARGGKKNSPDFWIRCRKNNETANEPTTWHGRRLLGTITSAEKQYVLHNVSVCFGKLKQSACKAHGPYFLFLWPGWLYHNSAHYLMKGTIFWYTLLNIRLVFWYSLQHLSETFFILSRTDRDMIRNVYWCSCKGSFILVGI